MPKVSSQLKTRTPKGAKGEKTKKIINDAILKQVHNKGFNQVTLKDICDETGLTIGAFYFHYVNKEKALEEVAAMCVRERQEDAIKALDQPTFEKEIYSVIKAYITNYADPDLHEQTRMLRYMIPTSDVVNQIYYSTRGKIIDHIIERTVLEKQSKGMTTGKERVLVEYLYCALGDFMYTLYFEKEPKLVKVAGSVEALAKKLTRMWYTTLIQG